MMIQPMICFVGKSLNFNFIFLLVLISNLSFLENLYFRIKDETSSQLFLKRQ